jgi:hypothetical protein
MKPDETPSINISKLWISNKQKDWLDAEDSYWRQVSDANIKLEKELEILEYSVVSQMSTEEFYTFLYDTYFVWKYTAKNRLSTTRAQLKRHLDNPSKLSDIQKALFSFDRTNIRAGLEIATRIHGLGIAGASGLLSVLFPNHFGTVDQFVVKALLNIRELKDRDELLRMHPESLTLKDGILLEQILCAKAEELNQLFQTKKWTPRKIDKVLWAYRE